MTRAVLLSGDEGGYQSWDSFTIVVAAAILAIAASTARDRYLWDESQLRKSLSLPSEV